MENSAVEKRLL